MKSYVHLYSALYGALIKDIVALYPSMASDLERDFSRLLQALRSEGLSFITVTHGAQLKAFLKALSQKEDLAEATELVRGFGAKSKEDVRPRYLHGLTSLVFSSDGTLLPDPDHNAIFFTYQWLSLARKVELPCSDEAVSAEIEKWRKTDEGLPDHHPDTWDTDSPRWVQRTGHPLWGDRKATALPLFGECVGPEEVDWTLFRLLCADLMSQFGPFDLWNIRPKHGPGATADQDRGLKYEFPTWPRKLQSIFPWDYYACSDFGLHKMEFGLEPDDVEVPCVMYAVPKTQEAPRLIAAEPTAHQWIQGGIQRWLEDRVASSALRHSINFTDQTVSQDAALRASSTKTHATIDLSEASDRISTRLVEYVFQSHQTLLDALHASRSRLLRTPDGGLNRLRKFAPMGSAVCFPVMTITLTMLSLFALARTRGWNRKETWKHGPALVQVFGDDIIVPTDTYRELAMLLSSVGLKVNAAKSYATGSFREACGMDAFDGTCITPVKVKRVYKATDPTSLVSIVDTANLAFERGLWHLSDALLKTVPYAERKLLAVGMPGGGALTLRSFTGLDPNTKRWWDLGLQHYVYQSIGVKNHVDYAVSESDAGLVQFFFEEPDPDQKYRSGQAKKPKSRKGRVVHFASYA